MVRVIDRAVLVGAFRKREREREGAVYVLLVLLFFIFKFFFCGKLNQITYRWVYLLIITKVVKLFLLDVITLESLKSTSFTSQEYLKMSTTAFKGAFINNAWVEEAGASGKHTSVVTTFFFLLFFSFFIYFFFHLYFCRHKCR